MAKIGLDSYQNTTKETWRGWQWNRIAELLGAGTIPGWPQRDRGTGYCRSVCQRSTAVYLVGPDDLDRGSAIKRGFRDENLVAIDLDKKRVKSVRKDGNLAIADSLQRILIEWPRGWDVDVVVADFCYGMVADACRLPQVLYQSKGIQPESVIAINLQRGRDAYGEWLRQPENIGWFLTMPNIGPVPEDPMKHRGLHAAFNHWYWQCSLYKDNLIPGVSRNDYGMELWRKMDCRFYSYPSVSNGVVTWFDSVVHRQAGLCEGTRGHTDEEKAALPFDADEHLKTLNTSLIGNLSRLGKGSNSCRGKVSALRAVRTVKLQKAGLT